MLTTKKINHWIARLETFGVNRDRWPEEYRSEWDEINEVVQQRSGLENTKLDKKIEQIQAVWKEESLVDQFFSEPDQVGRDFFETVVDLNPSLSQRSVFARLFEELFPKEERKFSLPITISSICLVFFFSWNFLTTSLEANFIEQLGLDSSAVSMEDEMSTSIVSEEFWSVLVE